MRRLRPSAGLRAERGGISALEPAGDVYSALADPARAYRLCANVDACGCNWLIDANDDNPYCLCCRHDRTLPDLSAPGNRDAWMKIEKAKRHLFYSLLRWRLPTPTQAESGDNGLAFDLLADGSQTILTGHENGLITLNIAEADDAQRESRRMAMGETYRTLLGHLRHEIGHYYWDRLVGEDWPLKTRGGWRSSARSSATNARTMGRRWRAIIARARRRIGPLPISAPMRPAIPLKISPRPGRITCTSSTHWRRRPPSASRSIPEMSQIANCASTSPSTPTAMDQSTTSSRPGRR